MKEFRGRTDRGETSNGDEKFLEENQPNDGKDSNPGCDVSENEPVPQATVRGPS